jgi:nitroreductase
MAECLQTGAEIMNSTAISPAQALQQLQWRYAVKKFDPTQKIPSDVWDVLEQSLVLSPSSFGMQPWKFFVVDNVERRQQLLEHSWNQPQVVEASHLVVLAIKKDMGDADVDRYIQNMSDTRNAPLEGLAGLTKMIKGFIANPHKSFTLDEWATRQVYIAIGQFMTSAAMLGVDTCPMEGFNPAKYDEILGLTELGYASTLVCPVGYRASDDKYATMPKVRYPQTDVIQHI